MIGLHIVHLAPATLAVLFVGCFFAPLFGSEPSPYPMRPGARWTYETSDGFNKTTEVENLTSLRVGDEKFPAAILRRTDGSERLVIRTNEQWMECGKIDPSQLEVSCNEPFIFFRWPLASGQRWTTMRLDFVVAGIEKILTPALGEKDAWRISYLPEGSHDPIGEMWIVPGVGPIKFTEHNKEYVLIDYTGGEGDELIPLADASIRKIFSSQPQREPTPPERTKWKQFGFWKGHELPWAITSVSLLGLMALSFATFLLLRSHSRDVEVLESNQLISALAAGGDLSQARRRLEKLADERPKFPDIRFQLAQIYKATGELDLARNALQEAIKINPYYFEAQFDLARLLASIGEFQSASERLQALSLVKPHYADIHMELGKVHLVMGKKNSAEQCFLKALELNPQYAEAKALLSQLRDPNAFSSSGAGNYTKRA
jgi:predicted negative regulator of RcsB-dependent stress response